MLFVLASCEADDFIVERTSDESKYQSVEQSTLMIRNAEGRAKFTTIEADSPDTTAALHLELSRACQSAVSGTLAVGSSALVDSYNAEYGTSYQAFPEELVSIGGSVSIAAGQTASDDISVSITLDGTVSTEYTYAIPLVVSSDNSDVLDGSTHFLFVKNMQGIKMTADKASGIKLFSCMEANTANPLFHLAFTLEESGKPLFDYVIVFSSHIVYDEEEQRCRVEPSTAMETMCEDYDTYIKPLHDKGIKVLLSILGSNDGGTSAGVAHLDDATAKQFAREVATYCYANKLDGVFYDDEYTGSLSRPGFVSGSRNAAARLCYETKMAMPDKVVVTYIYSRMYGFTTVDGVEAGDFVDYALNDYNATIGTSAYQGMTNSQIGIRSVNFAPAYARWCATPTNLINMRAQGYGAYMAYCLDFATSTWSSQWSSLQNIAYYLYDENLVDSGYRPEPEW